MACKSWNFRIFPETKYGDSRKDEQEAIAILPLHLRQPNLDQIKFCSPAIGAFSLKFVLMINLLPIQNFKRCFLLPLIFISGIMYAEGTKEMAPTAEDSVMLHTNAGGFGNFASYLSFGTSSSLNLRILDAAHDSVYIGLSKEATDFGQQISAFSFRILDPNGNVAFGPFVVGCGGPNYCTNATTWELASNGPDVNGMGGYSTDTGLYPYSRFKPTMTGDYVLQFDDGSPNNIVNVLFFDFTVRKSGVVQTGRLWSKSWALRTPSLTMINEIPYCQFNGPFNGQFYSYTYDGFVSKINFSQSDFHGLSFIVAFGDKGPGNSGNVITDRRSVDNMNSTTNNTDYKLFLNDPDHIAFPSSTTQCGDVLLYSASCESQNNYCIYVGVTKPGQIEIILDFNNNGVYDLNTTDILLAKQLSTAGTSCIPWNGIKGNGSHVGSGEVVPTVVRYAQGVQHYASYDIEFLLNGFCVETIRPICPGNSSNLLYWDDSSIVDDSVTTTIDEGIPGTGQPKIQLNGCTCGVGNCRTWDNFQIGDPPSSTCVGTPYGYGENSTLNTWWYANTKVLIGASITFQTPCHLPFIPPYCAIQQNGNQALIADPIQLGTGTYTYSHEDFNIPSINGPLKFTRFYNSLNSNLSSPLGYGWSHTYNYFLTNRQDTAWDIHYPDGHLSTFIPMNSSGQSFPIFSGTTDSLQKNSNNSFSLFTKEKIEYHFDSIGKLDSVIDLNGNITRLFYTGSKLDSVLAPGGRSLIMTYNFNRLMSVIDPLDRICSYSYDADSNLIRVVGPNMDTTSFTYDSLHRMISVVNPLGDTILTNVYDSTGKVIAQEDVYYNVTSIVYDFPNIGDATVTHPDSSQMVVHHDAFFRKTSEIDELNFTKTYTYDINSNETGFTNENNHAESRLFDEIGNLLSDTLPGGRITNIIYNHFNSPVQTTDANGNIKLFYRDSVNNNIDSIVNPDGSLLTFTYDSLGLVTQSIDGNGNITSYVYSAAGDLLSIQTATGIKLFTYDAVGRKITSTDENGHATSYVYDNNDNLTLITDALGRTIQNTYDANNQLLSSVDKNGYETSYTYDSKGRKINSTNPEGGVTAYTYDVRDNLISVTDPNNNTIDYSYDAKGRKISSTNALGITQYQYDAVGNLVMVIDPTNRITDYTYTPTNKKESQIDGLGNTTTFTYDLNDNLISVIDPLGRATAYGYDAKNRLISVTDAADNTTSISYDFNDNKVSVTDPMGHTQTYNYDAANRLVSYDDASGNNYTYSYDSVGNNLILTKPTGTITKVYDAANRVITTTNSTGNNYSYTYDNNDNVITMSNNAGTSTMTYDSLNQLIQCLDSHGNLVSFNYDSAGNKTSIIYPGNKIVSYAYDGANNLTSVTDWLNQTFTYSNDSSGRTSQLTYPNGITCQYGYDNAGRLDKKIIRLSTGQIISGSTLNIDAVGNRVSEQRLAQVPSMLPSISRAYDYANDDSMTSDSVWSYTNDNSGNRIVETDGTYTATYNFSVDNLLNSRIDTSGINNVYAYDPLGHRISKTIGSDVNEYVLDISSSLSQVLQITDSNGVVQSSYVYGHGLLERIDTADNSLFYHFDAQHNTVLLSDQDTLLRDIYTYDPFGEILSHSGSTTQPFTFLGEYGVEVESPSLYYVRARYYDAFNGRFISKDAYDYDLNNPQTINRYVYSVNNPISIFDYTGLFGEQDGAAYNYSGKAFLDGFSKHADKLNLLTGNFGYYSLKASLEGAGILGSSFSDGIGHGLDVVGYISTAAKVGNTIYKDYTGQISGTEAGLATFVELYPYLTGAIGAAIGTKFLGPGAGTAKGAIIGEYAGNIINSLGSEIGKGIANTTWGLNASNWLLKQIQ